MAYSSGAGPDADPRDDDARALHRLWRGDRGVWIAQRSDHDAAALEHDARRDAEEAGVPEHQVGQLADLDRADLVIDACAIAGLIVYFAT